MSLVSADGAAYKFEASYPTAVQMEAAAPIPTRNSFQFDLPAAAPAPAAVAGAAAGAPLFSSQPVSLGAPLNFAPSNPQRPKGVSGSAQLDFSEFESEIASMEAAKRAEFLEHLQVNAQKIRDEKVGTAALPSQIGDSKLFHEAVVKQYGKIHHLDLEPKKAFQTRKAKARDARRAKKAEDKADQMESRSGGAVRKAKHKNRAKGVY